MLESLIFQTLKGLVLSLVVFKIGLWINYEDGAFGVFDKFREICGVYDVDADDHPKGEIGKLINCPWCIFETISFVIAAIAYFPNIVSIIVWWLAMATIAIYINGRVRTGIKGR